MNTAEKTAELLGVRYTLFQRDGVIRFGPTSVDLKDIQYDNVWFSHEVESFDKSKVYSKLQLVGVSVDSFKAYRVGDGKKKPKRMMLVFRVTHVGNPFELTEHLMKIQRGMGAVTLKLTEEDQVPMFTVEVVPEETVAAETAAKGWPVANSEGVFENVKPLARYKSNADKKWTASLFVLELASGWTMAYECVYGTGKTSIPLVETDEPFASEVDAISYAANLIVQQMRDKCEKGSAVSKREAKKMRDWAMKYVQVQTLMEAAPEPEKKEYPD